MNPEPKLVPRGNSKKEFGKLTPLDALIMDNFETPLATTVDKACGNTRGALVERFIKPRA